MADGRRLFQTIQFKDRAELGSELCIAVADDVGRLKLGRLFGKEHAHILCNLSHPDAVGIGRHAGNVNAACVQVDEKQDVISDRPAQRPHSLREEVGGPNGFEVPLSDSKSSAAQAVEGSLWVVLIHDRYAVQDEITEIRTNLVLVFQGAE